jgi:hypothetical protein
MKLINQPFDGDKWKLKDFVDNVTTAFELFNPNEHDLLLKFVKIKIARVARSKLLVRDLTPMWHDVKQIWRKITELKELQIIKHVECLAADKGASESIASWSSRIDTMQSELREAAYRICDDEVIHAMGLINHLAKACFVQRFSNERIKNYSAVKGRNCSVINLHRHCPGKGISSFIC